MYSVLLLVVVLATTASFAAAGAATLSGAARWRLHDRMDVVSHLATCVAFLVVGKLLLPWHELPVAGWGLAAALTAFGALTSAFALRDLPVTRPDRNRAGRLVSGVANTAVAVMIIALMAS